jgi:hypothetical protein
MVMDNGEATKAYARLPLSVPFYYGWFIVALSFLANLTAAGIRSAPSVLIHPFEAEFGWSRTAIAHQAQRLRRLSRAFLGRIESAEFSAWSSFFTNSVAPAQPSVEVGRAFIR